jgi:hypothetical protein
VSIDYTRCIYTVDERYVFQKAFESSLVNAQTKKKNVKFYKLLIPFPMHMMFHIIQFTSLEMHEDDKVKPDALLRHYC